MLRSKLSTSVTAALLLGMVSITGCGANNSASGTDMHTNNTRGTNDGRIQVNSVRTNSYDKMEMSQDLADRVAAMPEVSSANVMVVGTSAYVAVKLDETNGKVTTESTQKIRSYSYGSGVQNNTSGMLSGSGRPLGDGMNNGVTGGRGTVNGTGAAGGTATATPGAYGSNYTDGTRMSRDIDKGMGTGIGIRSAAADDVTQEMKDKIAAEVKKYNTNIKNVYVSANPDFVERADYYAEEVRAGHPLKGFAQEFGTMVERIFPANSGS